MQWKIVAHQETGVFDEPELTDEFGLTDHINGYRVEVLDRAYQRFPLVFRSKDNRSGCEFMRVVHRPVAIGTADNRVLTTLFPVLIVSCILETVLFVVG